MNYLLDTHALLWSIFEPDQLPPNVQTLIKDPHQSILISAVSLWEISLKYRLGKLQFQNFDPAMLPATCEMMRYTLLPLSPEDAATYHLIQGDHHKDPFDRMLIRLAIRNDFILLSKDFNVEKYAEEGLKVLWE